MEALRFKKDVQFETGKTYSVCLRGARRYNRDEFDLSLYTPTHSEKTINAENMEKPQAIANIVSQKQFKFADLNPPHCEDNYDVTAHTLDGLESAMRNVYDDFERTEIVTILRFIVV